MNIDSLATRWFAEKEVEKIAIEKRRDLEDAMRKLLNHDETKEGTITVPSDSFKIKVVNRIDRKVDSDKVQELAAEYGLTEHLSSLFRWKPEINMTAWKAADEAITKPLLAAVTTKPSRPSFSIELKE